MNTKKENARSAADSVGLFVGSNIEVLIPVGAGNAISKAQLRKLTGFNDRTIRHLVHRARKEGHQILSNMDPGGYYLPEHSQETINFIHSMRRRAEETLAVADAVERSLLSECGQSLFEGGSPGE